MKKTALILSLLLAFVCGNKAVQAASIPVAALDTLNHYVIDNQTVSQFNGSQLVGKKIVSYQITVINPPARDPVRIHEILTEGGGVQPSGQPQIRVRRSGSAQSGEPAYVIDGKQVSKLQFENLNPAAIESITVVKNGTQEDVKQYEGWENGVILVVTKKVVQTKDGQVNIGYGVADSKDVSYSVGSVKTDENERYTTMFDYLRGKVSGVMVGPENSIFIRGINSMQASTKPLILVDGVEITDIDHLNLVNPNDVYSVDVLKDAAASIYGVKGANGVILITTKNGQKTKK